MSRHSSKSIGLVGRCRDDRGISLVELMVVVTILALVMAALYSLMIPVQQSTIAQTRVVDVQDNLRVALRAMSKDLRMAGLLVGGEPLQFDAPGPPNTDFTIRTRSTSGVLARIGKVGSDYRVTPPSMADQFSVGDQVRLLDAITTDRPQNDLEITGKGTGVDKDIIIFDSTPTLPAQGTVLILTKVTAATDPLDQTIRYRYDAANKVLTRQVNGGAVQALANNVSFVNFTYELGEYGYTKQVNIELEGKTLTVKDQGEKTRQVKTSVAIRNSF